MKSKIQNSKAPAPRVDSRPGRRGRGAHAALKRPVAHGVVVSTALRAAACAACLGFAAGVSGAEKAPLLKVGTLAPEGSSWHIILKEMGEKWKQAPGGGAQLRLYAGGVLGDEPLMVSKMRIGQIQGGVFTVVGLAQIDPSIYCLTVPMMYRSYEELDYVREKMQPILREKFRRKGFVLLNWADGGWVTFFSKAPVLVPEDLKKRKFFVWAGDNKATDLWKSAGYTPVPLAATDILPSLQTGLINTFHATPVSALSFQWFALAPHMTELHWAPLIGGAVLTQKAWDAIPEASRPAIEAAAVEAEGRMKAEIRTADDKALQVMKTKGLSVHPITPEQYAAWQKTFEDAYPLIIDKVVPEDVFRQAMRFRDEIRAKAATR
jgi:TRAP-type C4-dicarboxylate transport system substrate-binding protein